MSKKPKKYPAQLEIGTCEWAEAELEHKGALADPYAREVHLHCLLRVQSKGLPPKTDVRKRKTI